MPRFAFQFLPNIPLPLPAAIRDAIGNRKMYWSEEPLQSNSEGEPDGYVRPDLHAADHHTATMVTSQVDDSYVMHKPVIDIDLPCMLVPSTQPGHFHLYINKEMEWQKFVAILEALEDAGVVGKGYLSYTKRRGFATVRYPGVTKDNERARIAESKADQGFAPADDRDLEDVL